MLTFLVVPSENPVAQTDENMSPSKALKAQEPSNKNVANFKLIPVLNLPDAPANALSAAPSSSQGLGTMAERLKKLNTELIARLQESQHECARKRIEADKALDRVDQLLEEKRQAEEIASSEISSLKVDVANSEIELKKVETERDRLLRRIASMQDRIGKDRADRSCDALVDGDFHQDDCSSDLGDAATGGDENSRATCDGSESCIGGSGADEDCEHICHGSEGCIGRTGADEDNEGICDSSESSIDETGGDEGSEEICDSSKGCIHETNTEAKSSVEDSDEIVGSTYSGERHHGTDDDNLHEAGSKIATVSADTSRVPPDTAGSVGTTACGTTPEQVCADVCQDSTRGGNEGWNDQVVVRDYGIKAAGRSDDAPSGNEDSTGTCDGSDSCVDGTGADEDSEDICDSSEGCIDEMHTEAKSGVEGSDEIVGSTCSGERHHGIEGDNLYECDSKIATVNADNGSVPRDTTSPVGATACATTPEQVYADICQDGVRSASEESDDMVILSDYGIMAADDNHIRYAVCASQQGGVDSKLTTGTESVEGDCCCASGSTSSDDDDVLVSDSRRCSSSMDIPDYESESSLTEVPKEFNETFDFAFERDTYSFEDGHLSLQATGEDEMREMDGELCADSARTVQMGKEMAEETEGEMKGRCDIPAQVDVSDTVCEDGNACHEIGTEKECGDWKQACVCGGMVSTRRHGDDGMRAENAGKVKEELEKVVESALACRQQHDTRGRRPPQWVVAVLGTVCGVIGQNAISACRKRS